MREMHSFCQSWVKRGGPWTPWIPPPPPLIPPLVTNMYVISITVHRNMSYTILKIQISSSFCHLYNSLSLTHPGSHHQCRLSILHEDNIMWGHRFIHNTNIHYSVGSHQLLLLLTLLQPQSHIVLKLRLEQSLHPV